MEPACTLGRGSSRVMTREEHKQAVRAGSSFCPNRCLALPAPPPLAGVQSELASLSSLPRLLWLLPLSGRLPKEAGLGSPEHWCGQNANRHKTPNPWFVPISSLDHLQRLYLSPVWAGAREDSRTIPSRSRHEPEVPLTLPYRRIESYPNPLPSPQ